MFSKRIVSLLVGVCGGFWMAGSSTGNAAASSSSGTLDVNLFYDTLKDDGSWFNTTEYGDVWQPYIAYKSDSWRPYTDGYWTYTDGGWMFVSYENFGWAVYHYGRWTQLKDIGWAWVPGTEWSPAWVTWRESKPAGENGQPAANVAATTTDAGQPPAPSSAAPAPPREPSSGGGAPYVSENYIGWAPLPPDPEPVVYDSYYSYGPTVDVDFGIDPYDYCFTDVRYFGAPFIGGYLFDRGRSYDCCERSVNITNIYYNRNGGYRGFYNGGPRYERFQGVTENPIQRYNLRQQQGRAAQNALRAGQFAQVNGKNLTVVAPRFSPKSVQNGRVNFKNRGALPVTAVNHERPAAQANNEARQKARDTFRQQGEAFRAQNPDSQSARRAARQAARQSAGQPGNAPGGPGIATTPRARQEERQARQAARQAGANPGQGGGGPEAAQAGQPGAAAAKPQTRAERRAARGQARRQSSSASSVRSNGGDNGAASASRQQAREARRGARQSSGEGRQRRQSVPSVAREPRAGRGGGGGGERAFRGGGGGGGGGRAIRAGGGGGGGGGGGKAKGQGGGGGGGKKKG